VKRTASQPNFIRFESLPSPIGRLIHAALWENSTGPMQMRTLKNFCMTLTIDGSAFYESPVGGSHTLGPGDMVIVFPDVPHVYGPSKGRHWTEFFVDFDGPVFSLLCQTGMIDPAHPIFHVEPVEYWQRRLREIVESPLRGGPELVSVRVCQFCQFLVDAIAHHKGYLAGAENLAWLDNAKVLLDDFSAEKSPDPHQIAEQISMSYETFRKKFGHLTGLSPGAYRIHRAIDRAAHLLIEQREIPLKQVAGKFGFCNEFYFSKQFKKIIGVSPSEFRHRFFGAKHAAKSGLAK